MPRPSGFRSRVSNEPYRTRNRTTRRRSRGPYGTVQVLALAVTINRMPIPSLNDFSNRVVNPTTFFLNNNEVLFQVIHIITLKLSLGMARSYIRTTVKTEPEGLLVRAFTQGVCFFTQLILPASPDLAPNADNSCSRRRAGDSSCCQNTTESEPAHMSSFRSQKPPVVTAF